MRLRDNGNMDRHFSLRPLEERDAERMLAWMRDANVTRYLRIEGENKTIEDAQKFIADAGDESTNLHRAIAAEDQIYCGTVSLKNIDRVKQEAEYAITLHPEAVGTGAARAASKEILKIAFEELKLKRVYLNVMEKNIRAIRLYEKLGFSYLYSTTSDFRGNTKETLRWYEITPDQVRA